LGLSHQLREIKLTTAEIEHVVILAEVGGKFGCELVDALLRLLLLNDQASLAEDTEVLGDVLG